MTFTDEDKKIICRNIRRSRLEKNFRQQEVSKAMNFSDDDRFNRIENGSVNLKVEHLVVLSQIFSVNIEEFFEGCSVSEVVCEQDRTFKRLWKKLDGDQKNCLNEYIRCVLLKEDYSEDAIADGRVAESFTKPGEESNK